MKQKYRVTPKKVKQDADRWIVQRVADRKQFGKPFRLKTEALDFKLELEVKSGGNIDPMQKITVEDIDILLGNLKVFFKKLNKLKQNLNENK